MREEIDMNTTSFVTILVIIAICVVVGALFATKSGKRVRLRMSGTADEMISKDASTPEGAKAYYNVAIEKKNNDTIAARNIYSQMLGKISGFETQLRGLQKDAMKVSLDVQSCIDKGDDEGARIYLKKQQDIEEKMEIIKDALADLKENAKLQEETLEVLESELEDLKAEKDNAVLTLETAQVTKSLQATVGTSNEEEDKMLEKVRDGIKKQKEEADGTKIAYENSTSVQQQRLDKKMKDDEIEKKLQALKAKKGK